ncbi:MAG TPA: HD domain-containing phosphohydrolase [Stenomitos sp.]
MRLVMIHDVAPGARLGKTLYGEDGRILLHRGTELSEAYIDTLGHMGYQALYVLDAHALEVPLKEPISDRTRQEALVAVRDTFRKVREPNRTLDQEWTSRRILYNAATSIIAELQGNRDLNLQIAELRTASSYTFDHSVNVCLLGLALAERLGMTQAKLVDLAVGLLLHDIGKTLLSPEVMLLHEGAEPILDERYRQHARLGYDMLQQFGKTMSGPSRIIALQHHERVDGSGFPKGLTESEIHPFAQIAAIANTYDTLIHDLGSGHPSPPHQAMEYLMAAGGSHFNHAMVSEFLKLLVPFPLETSVRLSTLEEGLVVAVDRGLPMRPTVRVTTDPDGRVRPKAYELDLRKHPDITIVQAF